MKTFYRKTFSICIFLAVMFAIVGTAAATDEPVPAVEPVRYVDSSTAHPDISIDDAILFSDTKPPRHKEP